MFLRCFVLFVCFEGPTYKREHTLFVFLGLISLSRMLSGAPECGKLDSYGGALAGVLEQEKDIGGKSGKICSFIIIK